MAAAGDFLQDLRAGQAGVYAVFGGQGSGWFDELRQLATQPAAHSVMDTCLDALEAEWAALGHSVALPHGFNVRAWLADEQAIPSAAYLASAGVSVPLIFVTQVARLMALMGDGLDMAQLLRQTRGITGQSQGLFAACWLGLGLFGAARDEALRAFTRYLFYLGVRSQEAFPFFEPDAESVERSARVNPWRNSPPTPMAAVVDAEPAELHARLRRYNARQAPERRIYLSLAFPPDRVVLSADYRSLVEFNIWHADYFDGRSVKYVYVRSTCPFHSALMERVGPSIRADLARLDFAYHGSDLRVPVYSCHDGRNLQADDDLAGALFQDTVVRPLDWSRVLAPALDPGVSCVVDFGPGQENRHLTRRALEALGCATPVVSARPPAPRPALQPVGSAAE